jgi:hypothetical protein
MGAFYQRRDGHLIDYELYPFGDKLLRGPKPQGPYIAYLGAAQTFGTYCKRPFPNILGEKLDIGTMNFGLGGKGPEFYRDENSILEAANKAELVVVQIFSARSITNSVYDAVAGSNRVIRRIDNREMQAEQAFFELVSGRDPRGRTRGFLQALIEECRRNYAFAMVELLQKIERPTVLFYYSVRRPNYPDRYPNRLLQWGLRQVGSSPLLVKAFDGHFRHALWTLLGRFPHLVNADVVSQIKPHSNHYVECATRVGMPQKLIDLQGEFAGWNRYYPSPEMHEEAARLLEPICREILELP